MSETLKVKLYNADLADTEVGTTMSFGVVKFDARGCAEVEATEEDLVKLDALRWTGEPPPPTLAEQASAALPREEVALYCHDLRGEKVGTSFGTVEFDAKGFSSWNATEDELVKLRNLGWVFHPQPNTENITRSSAGKPLSGPTIEEFVNEGYLPENYPPVGFDEVPSDGLTQYKETGKGPWSDRVTDSVRAQRKREQAEAAQLREVQAKAEAAREEIAQRKAAEAAAAVATGSAPAPANMEVVSAPIDDAADKAAANAAAEKARAEIAQRKADEKAAREAAKIEKK